MTDFPPYPSGLRLAGRRVVVAGGGNVAQRRVPGLIAAGADAMRHHAQLFSVQCSSRIDTHRAQYRDQRGEHARDEQAG